ncbi:MAG: hypothetical protein AB8B83_05610 [Bdellovibrionales bacterium]
METSPKKGNFDFLTAANQGFRVTWENRLLVLRLMAIPFLVKTGCVAFIIFMGLEEQLLRHGLVMIPAYFAEGFLIAYVIRTLYSGDTLRLDISNARSYYNDIIAAMIAFVLIQLTFAFVVGYTLSAMPDVPADISVETANAQEQADALKQFLMALSVFAFLLWAFRFAWLHVVIAMGVPLSAFLKRVQSFWSVIPMLGCWLAVMMPLMFITFFVSQILGSALPDLESESAMLTRFLLSVFQAGCEIVVNLIAALAMSYGFKALMEQE